MFNQKYKNIENYFKMNREIWKKKLNRNKKHNCKN